MKESRNRVEPVAQWGPIGGQGEAFEPRDCWGLRLARVHVVQGLSSDQPGLQLPAVVCAHVTPPWPASYLCVPMMAQNENIGILYLQRSTAADPAAVDPAAARWSDLQVRLARTVADSLGLALANLRLRETLRLQSIRDPLTGLFNRRYLEETLDREIYRARREQKPLGVMMLDIDHFKDYNDVLGHEAGDELLRSLGILLKSYARAEDVACRYGGEEFVVILPGASLAITRERADAVCQSVRVLRTNIQDGRAPAVTISIGVAAYPEHGLNGPEVMRAADAALYQAKRAGRNQALTARSANQTG